MYVEGFASKLKKARNETGFTQREVAMETGIKQPTIASYELGRTQPDIENLGILADFYGVDLNWLLGTRGERTEKVKMLIGEKEVTKDIERFKN